MTDERQPPSLAELDARLREARRVAGLDPVEPSPYEAAGKGSGGSDMGLGLRIGVELVAGVILGLLLGLGLDKWLGIAPWGLIVGVFIGALAGFMNVYRVANGQGYAAGFKASGDGPPKAGPDA